MKYLALLSLILTPRFFYAQTTQADASLVLISSTSEPFDQQKSIFNQRKVPHHHVTIEYKKHTSNFSNSTLPTNELTALSPHQKSVLQPILITTEY